MACQASYESRSRLRQTDVAISAISAIIAAIPNQTSSGAAIALAGVTSSQWAEIAKCTKMNTSPT
jgi:hypothetical protein